MSYYEDFNILSIQIERAKENDMPIKPYVLRQINVLRNCHDDFVTRAQNLGYRLSDVSVVEIEIEQFVKMKELAQSINLPTDEYDNLIKDARIRVFGEENYKNFFGDE